MSSNVATGLDDIGPHAIFAEWIPHSLVFVAGRTATLGDTQLLEIQAIAVPDFYFLLR